MDILIITNSDDPHADVLTQRASLRPRLRIHRINTDQLAMPGHTWRLTSTAGAITLPSWLLSRPDVVWYRKPAYPEPLNYASSFVAQELEGLAASLIQVCWESRWVNRPDLIECARAKPPQLIRAKALGLRIPDTLVTTCPDELDRFADSHGGEIVVKPLRAQVIGHGRRARVVGTRMLPRAMHPEALTNAPCYAQERLRIRSEVRVIVMGHTAMAFLLTPRRAVDDIKQLDLHEIDHGVCCLSSQLQQQLIELVKSYGLEFAAIDLAIVDEGYPVFLELNPNGQWMWLEFETGVPLCERFLDFLVA